MSLPSESISSPEKDGKENAEIIQWFSDEIEPHEPKLRAYLTRRFPAVRDVDDVIQESYMRVWNERAIRPILFAKSFLFRIARHLSIDIQRRQNSSPVEAGRDIDLVDLADERSNVTEIVSRREKLKLLAKAIDSLPSRCRKVVVLRKVKFLSQKEVAAQLGLSEKTVESQLARGIKRCKVYLCKQGVYEHYFDESI